MRYRLPLPCGCCVGVTGDQHTQLTVTCVIVSCASRCRIRAYEPGANVYLWELLPRREGRPLGPRSFRVVARS